MKLPILASLIGTSAAMPLSLMHPTLHPRNNTPIHGANFQSWGFLILENTDFATAAANPTFKQIASMNNNKLLTNYHGVAHPSLPNYLATVAGTDFGITDDGAPSSHNETAQSIFDLLEAAGVTWKLYAENYPGDCFTGATDGVAHSYAAKHNPAIYMAGITSQSSRCANIVEAGQFATDVAAGTLPQWWYYVPTLNNDGHDTDVTFIATYLQNTWMPRFQDKTFTNGLAMVMTFDETESHTGTNQVYAALIGDALTAGAKQDATAYSHYSLLKTVEDNWSLGSLGAGDATAQPFKI